MAVNDTIPSYMEPCINERKNSIESVWLSPSDVSECLNKTDSKTYIIPLTPVYNGKTFNIQQELIHAGLSAISIKHYYGKCDREVEEDNLPYAEYTMPESFGYSSYVTADNSTTRTRSSKGFRKFSNRPRSMTGDETASSGLSRWTDRSDSFKPDCTQHKINFRNSFWNVHRPELCKLTWPQNYVSSATLIEHFHRHIFFHGPMCSEYHEDFARVNLLKKELNEYGRLKELASRREIPPDEKKFPFKIIEPSKLTIDNSKCNSNTIKIIDPNKENNKEFSSRFFSVSDDDEINGVKKIHRSKEEFCITIGRHVRKRPVKQRLSSHEERLINPDLYFLEQQEEPFIDYHWVDYEQSYGVPSDDSESTGELDEVTPLVEPCPALMLDDFCRNVGKVDLSDLRCNPDDF